MNPRDIQVARTVMLKTSIYCVASIVLVAVARAGEPVVLPLVVRVAVEDGREVVPAGFIADRVARANEIFEPYGVRFAVSRTVPIAGHAALETKADRDALAAYAERGAIDCFFVRSLRDVDDPSQLRRGVHWRSRSHKGRRYVIVSALAGPDVLAHELGHYLGNPSHSDVAGNLMSYTPGNGLPFLDLDQQARMHRAIAAAQKSRELTLTRQGE